jgi:[ribosomal protein S18]-alanine N-acetyltransferase
LMDLTGMLEFRFRPMRLEDVEQVYAIDVLSFALPWSERSYRYEVTENKASRCWVAEAIDAHGHREVAAMVVIWMILDEAHVGTVATHPTYRRHGLARKLLAHALSDAAVQGAVQAYLEVRRGNVGAQALYLQFGFEVVGVRPRYYRDNNEDALLMTLSPLDVHTFSVWME